MRLVRFLAVAFALISAGCDSLSEKPQADPNPVAIAASNKAPTRAEARERAGPPVRVACLQDKTRSAPQTRTPQLERQDVSPLIGLLRRRGGELAVGIIHASLRVSMARLRIDPPPSPPASTVSGRKNPLEEAEEEASRNEDWSAYEGRLATWKTEMDLRLEAFGIALDRLLTIPSDSPSSPVWGAVGRADLFLAESDKSWTEAPARYGVIISDGEDNTVHVAPVLSAGAVWLLVNGDGRLGGLGALKPKRFESIQAAFAEVVSAEDGR